MKEAEKIINRSEEWVNEDQKNRAAVVILADEKENAEWGAFCGENTQNRASHLFSNGRK